MMTLLETVLGKHDGARCIAKALADAAAKAGVQDVEAIARDYAAWIAFERQGYSLNDARAALTRARRAAAALRRATHLSPAVVALGGVGNWSTVAARTAEAAGELDGLADQARRNVEFRAASYAVGGRGNLAHLVAEPAKVRLVRALAALLPPDAISTTVGGPLYLLAAAVNDAVTGEGERGIAHALRVALTAFRRAGSIASKKAPVASGCGR
jgi:hypothetical protein